LDLEERLAATQQALEASQGELELARLELDRLNAIIDNSAKYRIPADLSAAIYDIALSEGLDPDLAYRLVRVESGFVRTAVSPMGAVGLTQVMPSTAEELSPGIAYHELFERDTNLRLGFRYLRQLLEKYNGDLHLALTAYNRGPGTGDGVAHAGGDAYVCAASAVLGLPGGPGADSRRREPTHRGAATRAVAAPRAYQAGSGPSTGEISSSVTPTISPSPNSPRYPRRP